MRYLEVGKIVTTHGIKGEVKVHVVTNDMTRFDQGSILFLGSEKEKIEVDGSRMHKNMLLLSFNKIQDINDVLKYVNMVIYCDCDLSNQDDDGYYFDDLIGCYILVNQEKIALVVDVMEVPQGAILVLKLNNGNERLVPFVDEFIGNVDLDNKTIELFPIEGLL